MQSITIHPWIQLWCSPFMSSQYYDKNDRAFLGTLTWNMPH